MAADSAGLCYYNNDAHQSSLFLNENAICSNLGENSSLPFGSPRLSAWSPRLSAWSPRLNAWSDPMSSYSESLFTAATFLGMANNSASATPLPDEPHLVYPTEEDLLLGGDTSEFLQQLHGCNNNNNNHHQPVDMHPLLVHTLKSMESSPDSSESEYFDQQPENHYSPQHTNVHSTDEFGSLQGKVFLQEQQQQQQVLPADSSRMSPISDGSYSSSYSSQGSYTSYEVTVAVDSEEVVKHEPPPLNMKRLEKLEDPSDDNIEAAEVSVDLIQNRRPFRCGQAGCDKTFKNPQTMKMHHKTHYTDGSAMGKDGLATLPTLTPSLKAGQNKKIPSRCPKCRKTFVGLYELRRHYGRKHSEGEKPFGCRKCAKKFYVEVDLRDHEKLCGEPIECKCGLKFAFKCNLVAHKKAHPACQDQRSQSQKQFTSTVSNSINSNNSSSNQSSTTSDEDSTPSPGRRSSRSPPSFPRGRNPKRHRVDELTSLNSSSMSTSQLSYSSSYSTATPDFASLPEIATFKAARYDFAGLQFSTDGISLQSSNMHYPGSHFDDLRVPVAVPVLVQSTMNSSLLGGLEHLGNQINSRKPQLTALFHYRHQEGDSAHRGTSESTSSTMRQLQNPFSGLHGAMVRLI